MKYLTLLLTLSLLSINTSAALYDRGNGMIYDSKQNITWLQDANYAKTSDHYQNNGYLNWHDAKTWVENLNYGGFTDWRLPKGSNLWAGHYFIPQSPSDYNGTGGSGYNNTNNELSLLFYSELNNKGQYSKTGRSQTPTSNSQFIDADTNTTKNFLNFKGSFWLENSDDVFSCTPSACTQTPQGAYFFETTSGYLGISSLTSTNFAWAVRDGDVASASEVPVPAAAWLMGSGLIVLSTLARRKK